MPKLCLNSRDELLLIDLEKVAYFQANGNYTQLIYIGSEQRLLTLGMSKIEELIKQGYPSGERSPFIRLGRSLIINQRYLSSISVLKQRIVLSDNASKAYTLQVPKHLLREYKDMIARNFPY